jgi:hypothetical protein
MKSKLVDITCCGEGTRRYVALDSPPPRPILLEPWVEEAARERAAACSLSLSEWVGATIVWSIRRGG